MQNALHAGGSVAAHVPRGRPAPAEEAGGSGAGGGRGTAGRLGEMQGDVWTWTLMTVEATAEASQGRSD